MTMPDVATGSQGAPGAPIRWVSDTTPAELIHFARPSSTDQIGSFLGRFAEQQPDLVSIRELGRSTLDAPIRAVRLGLAAHIDDEHALRVMLYGQQHGGEAAGMEACLMLVRDLAAGPLRPLLDRMTVWIVPQINPDGAAIGERYTATGADLNRGHHLLAEPEHRALYSLFHEVRPHLTVDHHEHGVVRDPHFLPEGAIDAYDLLADGPTNLNIGPRIRPLADDALDAIDAAMTKDGFSFRRYVPYSDDGPLALVPRYSNLAIYGGRGQPTIWGCLAFLTEASRHPDVNGRLERRSRATYSAARAMLEFADERADEIVETVETGRQRLTNRVGQPVVLRGRYRIERQDPPLQYAYLQTNTGETGVMEFDEAATATEVVVERAMPAAYWIDLDAEPATRDAVLQILDGHHVHYERSTTAREAQVETYRIADEQPAPEDGLPIAVSLDQATGSVPAGALLVPADQLGATLVALLLEPESMNGLAGAGLLPATPGSDFPVKRLVGQPAASKAA